MFLLAVSNVAVAGGRVISPAVSPHQAQTDALYLGLAALGLLGAMLALWGEDWRPRERQWWIVAFVVVVALTVGLSYLHSWPGGSYVHFDRGLPLPWIKGAALVEGFPPGEAGPIRWTWAGTGFVADLLLWMSLGYGVAVAMVRRRGRA